MKERWKPVRDFEGLYEVSDRGRFRSLVRQVITVTGQVRNYRGKFLQPVSHLSGYLTVACCVGGTMTKTYLHRLVLETFVGPCPSGEECSHLDGNKTNNCLENLKWSTRAENCLHDSLNSSNKNKRLPRSQVRKMRRQFSLLPGSKTRRYRILAGVYAISPLHVHTLIVQRTYKAA